MHLSSTLRSGLFWSGSLTFVLIGAAAAIYGPALPAFARLLDVSEAQAGLLVSAHNAGGLIGLLAGAAFGGLSARQSLGLLALGAGLIAAGAGWAVTFLGALVMGAGYGLVSAVFNRRFLTENGTYGPAMVGFLNAVFGIGAIGGPLMLVALSGDPRLAYGVVAAVAVALIPFARGGGLPPAAPGGFRLLLSRPGILALGAAAVGFEVSLIGLGPTALVGGGITESRAAELASLFFAFFLLGRLSLVWAARRFAPLTLLAFGFASGGVLVALASVLPPSAFFALAGASVGVLFPSYFVAAAGILGTGDRAASMILAAAYIGSVTLPAVTAGLLGGFGSTVVFPMLASFALAAALGTLAYARCA